MEFVEPAKPLLAKFAVERGKINVTRPGRYCPNRHVWIIDVDGIVKPIVEYATSDEFIPLTKVDQERSQPFSSGLLELVTKTAQQMEGDDAKSSFLNTFLELSTKTETAPERDDK